MLGMVLDTNLTHIDTPEELDSLLSDNENVMLCVGRMGPMCVPVYDVMEEIEDKYSHVKFADLLFDNPTAGYIRSLPETENFTGLPFTVYFKNGKVVAATSSIQTKKQVTEILEKAFAG